MCSQIRICENNVDYEIEPIRKIEIQRNRWALSTGSPLKDMCMCTWQVNLKEVFTSFTDHYRRRLLIISIDFKVETFSHSVLLITQLHTTPSA